MMAIDGKPVIGLLGAPGSGKSTVAGEFARQGAGVIDADALSREAMQSSEVRDQLVAWWGEAILAADGSVDRRAVSQRVFGDREALKALEGLIHPRVKARRRAIRQQLLEDPAVAAIVEDSPLLMEAGLDAECDALVLVDAPHDQRLSRLAAQRGWSAQELTRRENQQMSLDTKRRRADYVISNYGDEAACRAEARRVFSLLLHR